MVPQTLGWKCILFLAECQFSEAVVNTFRAFYGNKGVPGGIAPFVD